MPSPTHLWQTCRVGCMMLHVQPFSCCCILARHAGKHDPIVSITTFSSPVRWLHHGCCLHTNQLGIPLFQLFQGLANASSQPWNTYSTQSSYTPTINKAHAPQPFCQRCVVPASPATWCPYMTNQHFAHAMPHSFTKVAASIFFPSKSKWCPNCWKGDCVWDNVGKGTRSSGPFLGPSPQKMGIHMSCYGPKKLLNTICLSHMPRCACKKKRVTEWSALAGGFYHRDSDQPLLEPHPHQHPCPGCCHWGPAKKKLLPGILRSQIIFMHETRRILKNSTSAQGQAGRRLVSLGSHFVHFQIRILCSNNLIFLQFAFLRSPLPRRFDHLT